MHNRRFSIFPDEPRSMRDERVRAEREDILQSAQNMASLVKYVDTLRRPGIVVPDFDPLDGGNEAKVLFLLEKPGTMTSEENGGSGFISRNNNDPTAENLFRFMRDEPVALPRELTAIWNVIPFWNGKIALTSDEWADGAQQVQRLLDQFPQLCAVVLVGRQAQKAKNIISSHSKRPQVFCSYHPSGRNHKYHGAIVSAWSHVKTFLNRAPR